MRLFFLVVLFLALGFAESLIPYWRATAGVTVPFVLAGVLYFAMRHEGTVAATAAVLGGLLHDVTSLAPFGLMLVFFLVLRAVMQRGRKVVCTEALYPATVFGAAWAALAQIYFFVLTPLLGRRLPSIDVVLVRPIAAAGLGWCAVALTFPPVAAIERFLGLEPNREEERHVSD